MSNNQVISASEARDLTVANPITINSIMDEIRRQAEHGLKYVVITEISDELIDQLKELSYKVSLKIDGTGVEHAKIEW